MNLFIARYAKDPIHKDVDGSAQDQTGHKVVKHLLVDALLIAIYKVSQPIEFHYCLLQYGDECLDLNDDSRLLLNELGLIEGTNLTECFNELILIAVKKYGLFFILL